MEASFRRKQKSRRPWLWLALASPVAAAIVFSTTHMARVWSLVRRAISWASPATSSATPSRSADCERYRCRLYEHFSRGFERLVDGAAGDLAFARDHWSPNPVIPRTVNITFDAGGEHLTHRLEPRVRWQPKLQRPFGYEDERARTPYTFELQFPAPDRVTLQIFNEDGLLEGEIDDGSLAENPPRGRIARDPICRDDSKIYGGPLDDPRTFLTAIVPAFERGIELHCHAPEAWADVAAATRVQPGLHYAVAKHTEDDARAKPPSGSATWLPYGSTFWYVITRSDAHDFEVRSYNNRGLQDYFITRHGGPTPISSPAPAITP